jgi:hypothetical protein
MVEQVQSVNFELRAGERLIIHFFEEKILACRERKKEIKPHAQEKLGKRSLLVSLKEDPD